MALPDVAGAPPPVAPVVKKPKSKAKGKAKGKKGRGRGRGKFAGRGAGRAAQPVAAAAPGAEGAEPGAPGAEDLQITTIVKIPRAPGIKKKVLNEIGDKPLDEALADAKSALQTIDAQIEEAQALEEAQGAQAAAALKEFEEAKREVEEAIKKEHTFADRLRSLNEKKKDARDKVDAERRTLNEVQKKLAVLEVMATSHQKMEALEARRREATAAAEAAKRAMLEQKQREKEALEATRKAITERGMAKPGRGQKRAAPDAAEGTPTKKGETAPADEQATVPATQVEATQLGDDID